MSSAAISTAGARSVTLSGVELGPRVQLRDVQTMDDLADVTAPEPVEPGDLVASTEEFFRVEVVLWTPLAPCVPVLARREELGAS